MKAKQGNEIRTVVSQGVIALMVCIGGYMFLVDPQVAKIAKARAEEESFASQARAAESLRDNMPAITAAVARSTAEAERIHKTGRMARQEQELYATLTSIANNCRVRIDQMTPNKIATSSKPGQGTEVAEGGPNAALGYTIDASASYGDLVQFLRAIRTELGYTVVKAVRLTPTFEAKSKLVHAFIETEHYAFDASPVNLVPDATASAAGTGGGTN